jgi:transcription elongation GreA/GreB family factor
MHKLLMRRKGELENLLVRARGSDFANPKTDAVGIGTVVHLTDLHTQQSEKYTILGAWDFDADKHIISYLSPMAQAIIGHKPGEDVEFELEGAKKHYRIDSIESYTPPAAGQSGSSAAPTPAADSVPTAAQPVEPAPGPASTEAPV